MQLDSTTNAVPSPKFPRLNSDVPYTLGFEDGLIGKSVYEGYGLFAGKRLVAFKQGWRAGKQFRRDGKLFA